MIELSNEYSDLIDLCRDARNQLRGIARRQLLRMGSADAELVLDVIATLPRIRARRKPVDAQSTVALA